MEYGQPPSWRPEFDQFRAEAFRGTVRDALGGLRNVEQLLGSLRVGPRALSSVLPDIRTSCPALAAAIAGLGSLIGSKLVEATHITTALNQLTQARLDELVSVIESLEQQQLHAKNRLRLEEAVCNATRDIEAIVDLVDLLGEVAWGRTMSLDVSEVAREAYRSGEPPLVPQPAVWLTLWGENSSAEHTASPRALVLILQHLVRWSAHRLPDEVPRVSVALGEHRQVVVLVEPGLSGGERRWIPGRRYLAIAEDALRCAASAMDLELKLQQGSGRAEIIFPTSPTGAT